MLTWKERYASKITSAAEAIGRIQPWQALFIGSGAAEPATLVQALVEHGDHLSGNEILHILTVGPAPYVAPEMARRFRHTAFFIGENVRAAVQAGRADYVPIFLSEIPELLRRRPRVEVALIQVSEPDTHGFVSLGVSVDVVRAATEQASMILAEVNPRMPRTLGDSMLHVDRLTALIPVDYALPERAPEPLDDVDLAIGRHVASLIPDGATLQVGIGKVPNAVLASLSRHRSLGVHSEMISDGVMRLVEQGVIDGRRKTLLPGKIVTSFLLGSRALYEWAHDNPQIEMRASDFTNDPFVIAQNERMMAINSAVAVDLTGQGAADYVDGKPFSGFGGQVDFLRGASRSRGGKAIIALRSTAKGGTISKIQPTLPPRTGVVATRGDMHYVVTEYGVAELWGKSTRQRALALCEIAHPSFRSSLLAAAREQQLIADHPGESS